MCVCECTYECIGAAWRWCVCWCVVISANTMLLHNHVEKSPENNNRLRRSCLLLNIVCNSCVPKNLLTIVEPNLLDLWFQRNVHVYTHTRNMALLYCSSTWAFPVCELFCYRCRFIQTVCLIKSDGPSLHIHVKHPQKRRNVFVSVSAGWDVFKALTKRFHFECPLI